MTSPAPSESNLHLARRLAEQLAVERVRQGDALALEMIFTAFRRELLDAAQEIMGSPHGADDVLQEVFLAIWAGRQRWHVTTSLRAYLRRAVCNGAARATAARNHGGRLVDLDNAQNVAVTTLAGSSPTPDIDAEQVELRAAIAAAANELPPRARQVFMLKRFDGLSNQQIAARLGLSVKTVEIHMTRAFTALRRRLAAWR